MTVFISHSHEDKDFVDRLATRLIDAQSHVWLDRWELHVGDSLIERIQDAIGQAEAIIFVLSQASVNSQWCRKELSSGLIRELEEERVLVLPALYEDCDIPTFLRDKKYADFRDGFEEGLKDTLSAVARVTSQNQGHAEQLDFHTDWAIDWGVDRDRAFLEVTLVSYPPEKRFSVVTEIDVTGNQAAAHRLRDWGERGLGRFIPLVILETCREFEDSKNLRFYLEDSSWHTQEYGIKDSGSEIMYDVRAKCRHVGENVGRDTFFDYGQVFSLIRDTLRKRTRPPSEDERREMGDLVFGSGAQSES